MPLVVVCRNPATISDETLRPIAQYLPELVAEALTIPDSEAMLTPAEVEVWVQDFGPFDVTTKDIEIIIWAHDYPERLRNLDER